MAGAAEVQEDRQLKVDLPIDQVKHNPILYSIAAWWGLVLVYNIGPVYLTESIGLIPV